MKIHDKYVIELKEVIKGFGNDPQVKDPLKFPCDYKFYEIDGVAICENSFKKMKRLEDIAIPKEQYEARLKADMVAMLTDIQLEIAELPVHVVSNNGSILRMEIAPSAKDVYEIIQQKINALEGKTDVSNEK